MRRTEITNVNGRAVLRGEDDAPFLGAFMESMPEEWRVPEGAGWWTFECMSDGTNYLCVADDGRRMIANTELMRRYADSNGGEGKVGPRDEKSFVTVPRWVADAANFALLEAAVSLEECAIDASDPNTKRATADCYSDAQKVLIETLHAPSDSSAVAGSGAETMAGYVDHCVTRVENIVVQYEAAAPDEAVADITTDLMHYAKAYGVDWHQALWRATQSFQGERHDAAVTS